MERSGHTPLFHYAFVTLRGDGLPFFAVKRRGFSLTSSLQVWKVLNKYRTTLNMPSPYSASQLLLLHMLRQTIVTQRNQKAIKQKHFKRIFVSLQIEHATKMDHLIYWGGLSHKQDIAVGRATAAATRNARAHRVTATGIQWG